MKSDIKSDTYDDADDVVGVVGGGDGVHPLGNGPRKSQKKFQHSKLRIVDRRSRLVEGPEILGGGGGGGGGGGLQVNIVSDASLQTRHVVDKTEHVRIVSHSLASGQYQCSLLRKNVTANRNNHVVLSIPFPHQAQTPVLTSLVVSAYQLLIQGTTWL